MATTPLWVPLAVAGLAVAGTLTGVIFTQAWNSRLEERRWAREAERLREAQAREDVNRTYEHRRAAYVDFLRELEKLQRLLIDPDREGVAPPFITDPVFNGLLEQNSAVMVYGTVKAQQLAAESRHCLILAAVHPEDGVRAEDAYAAYAAYLSQIRKDLGVPEPEPAGE